MSKENSFAILPVLALGLSWLVGVAGTPAVKSQRDGDGSAG